MDYTTSLDYVIDPNTGQRIHQDNQAVPTVWSAKDACMLIWELMEIVKAGGIAPKAFNPADPQSYTTVLRALQAMYVRQGRAIAYYDAVPAAKAEPVIYVTPFGVMTWSDSAKLYRSVDCGAVILHSATTARAGYIKGHGVTLSKTTYAGLWSWAQENGLVVASAAWTAGTAMYADLGGDNFRTPDLRGEFFRAWDEGRGVDAGRQAGSWQKGTVHTLGTGPSTDTVTDYSTYTGDTAITDMGLDIVTPDGYPSARAIDTGASGIFRTAVALTKIEMAYGVTRPRNVALTVCIKF